MHGAKIKIIKIYNNHISVHNISQITRQRAEVLGDVQDRYPEHLKSITRIPPQTQPQTPVIIISQLNSTLLMCRLNI